MLDSFLSFYKRGEALNSPFNKNDKFTSNSRTHHQSQNRLMKMDGRKSGKNNLVAVSQTKKSAQHPLINQFMNSGVTLMPNLKWNVVQPVFAFYKIKHEADPAETYTKSIHGIKCNMTGAKIYIKYFPERESWTLFKR
jgi:hypothetical protein